jgi:uncharacterized protein
MTEIITYSLYADEKRSDGYYRDISTFTDEVLRDVHAQASRPIAGLQAFLQEHQLEDVRSFDEYAFEFLMLGVFWNVHMPAALRLPRLPQRILANFGRWRKQSDFFKPGIDFLRGIIGTLYLADRNNGAILEPAITIENLSLLLGWLAAAGDFPEELGRLQLWGAHFESIPAQEAEETLKMAISLGTWFEARSQAVLGLYTPHVENFIHQEKPFYRWREDIIFCSRQRVEYHLAMVGTEILNRSLRGEFLASDRKVVLLPPCMKAKLNDGCEAVETPLGERCMACEPGCRVHQLTKLGEKHGFAVMVMAHDLDVFSGNEATSTPAGQTGVVGVSCPLTNVAGGWEMKKIGAPAQGILLDYCGCPWHWHEDGIATDINFKQVLKVLGIKD